MRFLLIGLLLCLPEVIFAATPPVIQEYTLSNGLKVIVKEDHRAPVAFASVWYKVGSSYEPAGITGISHALEHMMFRGTRQYGPGKLSEIVNLNGGEQNAMTSDDFTVFFESLPVEKLEWFFKLESDRMSNLTLDPKAFANEIQVVMEERRMRTEDSPQSLTTERFNAIAFINNPYQHPVVGWMSDLQQMTVNDLRAWYHTWYAPNNAVLVVVGDVHPFQVLALAKQYFGPTPAKNLPVLKPTQEVPALGTRSINVRIPAQLPWIILGYNTPSLTIHPHSQDPYALTVLAYLLGGSDSSRLNRDLVRGRQLAVSVSVNSDIYNLHSNLFTVSAIPRKNVNIQDLRAAIEKEIQTLQLNLVDSQELERAKASLAAAHVYEQDSTMYQAINLGIPEVTGLSWREEMAYVDRIENVTPEQIRSVAKRYLNPESLTVGTLTPIIQPGAPAPTGEPHENTQTIR